MRETLCAGFSKYQSGIAIRLPIKILPALAALAILIVATVIVISSVLQESPAGTADPAVKLAMSDPGVQWQLSHNNVRAVAESKPFDSTGARGFLNYSHNITWVHIALKSPSVPPPDYNYYFLVDSNENRIVYRNTFFDVMAGDEDVTIPAGAAWYGRMTSSQGATFAGGLPRTSLNVSYNPADTKIVGIVTDREGLYAMMNDSQITPLNTMNLSRYALAFNGTIPGSPGGNTTLTWPAVEVAAEPGAGVSDQPSYRPDNDYYLVVVNEEPVREVCLTMRIWPGNYW